MSAAAKCRANGWIPGTLLVGDEGYGPTVIRITAVGEEQILAVMVSQNGIPTPYFSEGEWSLNYRNWKKAEATDVGVLDKEGE